MMGQHWANNMSCIDTSTPCTTGRPWSCLWTYIEAQFPPTCYIAACHDRNLLRVLSTIFIGNLRDGVHIIIPYRATLKILYHPLEVVFRHRDLQLQVGENYSYFFNLKPTICKYWCLNTQFVCNSCFSAVFLICRHVVRIDDKLSLLTKKYPILTTMILVNWYKFPK